MNLYYITAREVEGEFLWSVIETSSDYIINDFKFEDEAIEYVNFLIHGGAFDGHTPAFILKNKLKANLEDLFSLSVED